MQLPSTLTDEQSAAIVDCLRMFAAHGRAIREERERQQKTKDAETSGEKGAASLVHDSTTLARSVIYEQT